MKIFADSYPKFRVVSDSGKTYTVELNRVYEDYEYTAVRSCTCNAFKYSRCNVYDHDCKHLRSVENIASIRWGEIRNAFQCVGIDIDNADDIIDFPYGVNLLNDNEFSRALSEMVAQTQTNGV